MTGGSITTQGKKLPVTIMGTPELEGRNFGIFGQHQGSGNIGITVSDGSITTKEVNSTGILGQHQGSGNVVISMTGGRITIEKGITAHANVFSTGIRGYLKGTGTGNIEISMTGGRIATQGTSSRGIFGEHEGTGNIGIAVKEGGRITTTGARSYGIYGQHSGTDNIGITVSGGSITTQGADSPGILGEHKGKGNVAVSVSGGGKHLHLGFSRDFWTS